MDSATLPIAECPAEGCDRGPMETEAALRGHANATGPEHPSWREVQQLLDERGDQDEPEDGVEDDTSEEAEEMPTQQEYEDQHTDTTTDDTDTDTSAGGAPALPMDPKTLGMLLAAALVLWLAYRALDGGGDDGQGIDQGKPGDSAGADSTETAGEIQGGLAG